MCRHDECKYNSFMRCQCSEHSFMLNPLLIHIQQCCTLERSKCPLFHVLVIKYLTDEQLIGDLHVRIKHVVR